MRFLDILRDEHGVIRRFLDNLHLAVEKLEQGERSPKLFFEKAVELCRDFADKHPHFKEEDVMFVQLAQQKTGEVNAQINVLRQQHERGRNYVVQIANSLHGYAAEDSVKTSTLIESLAAYNSLLRIHIHTEDHVFYNLPKRRYQRIRFKPFSMSLKGSRKSLLARTYGITMVW